MIPDPPPRPEPLPPPKPTHKSQASYEQNWREWQVEYETWKDYTCACKNAYFCRAHGQWVSGEDVRNRAAAPQQEETPATCHRYGYFCKAHNEWVTEEAVRKKKSPNKKSQTAKTCHTDGYFCKAHQKWVAGVLIRNNLAAKEKHQTSSTCHKKNQRVSVASWHSSDTNGCHSGNGQAAKDLLSTSVSSSMPSYSTGGMVGSAPNNYMTSTSTTNPSASSTGNTWGQPLGPSYEQSTARHQYSTVSAAAGMRNFPSALTPSGSMGTTYSSSQAINTTQGYFAPQPSSYDSPTEVKPEAAGSFQSGSADMYTQDSPVTGESSVRQTQFNNPSGYYVTSPVSSYNPYNQYPSGSTSIDPQYNSPGDYSEAQSTDQSVPAEPQEYYDNDEEYQSEDEYVEGGFSGEAGRER